MGEALDYDGHVIGRATGETKRDVFENLTRRFPDAEEIRIRKVISRVREREEREELEAEAESEGKQ